MASHNELGKQGEEVAKQFLLDKGYEILAVNWRSGRHEIDIVAQKFNFISVIEVKTRSSNSFGYPETFINRKKMRNLISAADEYLIQHNLNIGVRYEIIALIRKGNTFDIEHFEEAFDANTPYAHYVIW